MPENDSTKNKKYDQVRALMTKALHPNTPPEEAKASREKALEDLLNTWTPADLKVAVAIASGWLSKQAWEEMGSAGREKLFRPRGFKAWEERS